MTEMEENPRIHPPQGLGICMDSMPGSQEGTVPTLNQANSPMVGHQHVDLCHPRS